MGLTICSKTNAADISCVQDGIDLLDSGGATLTVSLYLGMRCWRHCLHDDYECMSSWWLTKEPLGCTLIGPVGRAHFACVVLHVACIIRLSSLTNRSGQEFRCRDGVSHGLEDSFGSERYFAQACSNRVKDGVGNRGRNGNNCGLARA